MLQNLHVKNLALIDEADVEFKNGLNILTGETGAGKSIIIGSLNLALGEKVNKEMLRENGDAALVELIFSVDDETTREAIRALDIEPEDDTVILSRKVSGGRAIGRINGESVSASKMKSVASLLIDIHGQHEHQSLLSKKEHLKILDSFAKDKLGDKKERLSECYHNYKALKEEWENSNLDSEERARELSFLEYEVKEIREADLTPGEDEELEKTFNLFQNGKKIMDAVSIAHEAVSGDGNNASELIGRGLRELNAVAGYDARVEGLAAQLSDIENLLSDAGHELSAYMDEVEFDDETFFETEKRLDLINHLKSKYGRTIEEILKNCEEKESRIEVLNDYDAYLKKQKAALEKAEKELKTLSAEVSEIRKCESENLCVAIKKALGDLNFLDVAFDMSFEETGYSANGTDDAQFLISTNPGEPEKPLQKVASGGELSRIALAVKTVMAESDAIETLIFDEIDSGISGRTAQMVSEKMNLLSRTHQIICITHLPQIAAMADCHFLIEKSVENKSTVSRIHPLSEEESVDELARMLGGVEITDTVRDNAKEMRTMAMAKKM
jgi:DNA repair protein RecN (Recombination protein N)